MKPIETEMSNEFYHRSEETSSHISSTQLKHYLVSPAYYKWLKDHPELNEETPAMKLGTQFHGMMELYVKYGDAFEEHSNFVVFNAPLNEKTGQPYGETTAKYKDALAAFLKDNDGKEVISAQSLEKITAMCKSIISHPENKKLLEYAKPREDALRGAEVSFFAELKEGIFGKCRVDSLTSNKIIDYKSCSCDLNPDALAKQIVNFSYDVSAAFYQLILFKITGQFYSFYWIFVNNKSPYLATPPVCANNWCFSSIEDLIQFENDVDCSLIFNRGVMVMRLLLNEHAKCVKNNHWPGPEVFCDSEEGGNNILQIDVPSWANNQIPVFYK